MDPATADVAGSGVSHGSGLGLPDRSRQHLVAVRTAAGQLALSIDDVLDMAQIDAGEMALSLGDVSVGDILRHTADRIAPKLAATGGQGPLDLPDDLGLIRADEIRLAKIGDQLADNAVRALESGGQVGLRAERTPGGVRIGVSDTGRGVAFHKQAQVFDRFVGRDRGGPGLSLALVKAVSELHGGSVALESDPGHGATFFIDLPTAAESPAIDPELALDAS